MRLDSANRSFATLVLSSLLLGMYAISGAAGCVLVPLIIARASRRGVGGLFYGAHNLLAALAFLLLISVGLALAIISARKQIRASRALTLKVQSLSLQAPEGLEAAAAAAGLSGRVVLVDCPEFFSFAFGALTPKVAVSRGLLEGISRGELRAVLEHECYHVRNLDPLKMLIVRTLPEMFFFLPALAALRSRYVLACELAADRHAVRACGREPLVRALLKVVRGPRWSELEAAVAIGGEELLDLRISQLESGHEPKIATLSPVAAVLSLLGVLLLVGAFIASVASFGGPAAVTKVTGIPVSFGGVLGEALCVLPFALGGLAVYRWMAWRAREPLGF